MFSCTVCIKTEPDLFILLQSYVHLGQMLQLLWHKGSKTI